MPGQPPIRILFVIATLDRAGAEGQLTALLNGLDKDKFEPFLLCLTRGGPYEAVLRAAGVPYEILGKKSKFDLSVVLRIGRKIHELRPDILHTWMFTSNAFGRVSGLLYHVPTLIASERAADVWKTWLYRLTDRLLAPWTSCIVTNASSVRQFVLEESGIPEARTFVIPNGIDCGRFVPKVHQPVSPVSFCSLGRLVRQKRMDVAIRAMAILKDKGIPARLDIYGDGILRNELAQLVRELGLHESVRLRPPVQDVRPVLAAADALVLSSDWEGMPNVVLEAMAAGLPAIASAVDGCTETISHDQTGLLVDPGLPEAFARAMEELAASVEKRRALGHAARRKAKQEFSVQRMIQRYEELYLEYAG